MLKMFRNLVFLSWLCGALAATSVGLTIWAAGLTVQVASMSAAATASAIRHRKAIARAVARERAKGRLKRAMAMVPVAGLAAGAWFERQEYREWLEENPEGDRRAYGCHVLATTTEVMDEVLADLPDWSRPDAGSIEERLPVCDRVVARQG